MNVLKVVKVLKVLKVLTVIKVLKVLKVLKVMEVLKVMGVLRFKKPMEVPKVLNVLIILKVLILLILRYCGPCRNSYYFSPLICERIDSIHEAILHDLQMKIECHVFNELIMQPGCNMYLNMYLCI